MKNLFSVLFLFFILTSAGGSSLFGQSNFLKQFESSIDIAQILSDTAANIDVVEIEGGGGNDTYVVNGNTEIRNRTFEAEIRRIRASENLDLLKLLNGSEGAKESQV